MCAWEPESLCVVHFNVCVCMCACVFLSTAGEQEVTDPLWVLGMNILSSPRTSCPRLFPAPDSPGRVRVYHGSVTTCLPHAHPFLHCQEGHLSSGLYFAPLGGGSELGKESMTPPMYFSILSKCILPPSPSPILGTRKWLIGK